MTAKAKVRIEGENATAAAWRQVVGDAQTASKKMSGVFRAAFAGISISAIVGVGKAAVQAGDDLNNAAKEADIAGSTMSELAYVAKQSDIELTALSKSIKTMKVNLSEAASGGKAPIATLKAIGIEIKDLRGLKADEQFMLIGDAISRMGDATDRSRALTELFGKAGDQVGRAFENGADGIRKLREEAIATGAALSNETIAQLAATDDEVKKLEASWAGFTARMTAKYAPALRTAMDFWSGAPTSLAQQVADQEELIEHLAFARGPNAASQKEAARKKLNSLRQQLLGESSREMGVMPQRSSTPAAPGFVNQAEIDAAEKANREMVANQLELNEQFNADMMEQNQARFDHEFAAELENREMMDEVQRESAERMKEFRAEQAEQLSAGMQVFKDGFLNAWDDMVNTGKFKWDELLKYMIAEFARKGIVKLFDGLFSNGGTLGGGFGGGIGKAIGAFFSPLKGLFGGGRAEGGGVQAGKFYRVGERGPEMIAAGANGTVIPNHALGGSMNVSVVNNIDARGATTDFAKALPGILAANRRATIAEVVERLNRRSLGVR